MAHRGGSLEGIENTLPAFAHAVSAGANMLELDVHSTKDGHVVVFHDDDLGRMCGNEFFGRGVGDFDLAQLPLLIVPETLEKVVKEDDLEARRMPLLEDVFRAHPSIPISIDVKHGSEEMIIKVGTLIKQYNRTNNTVWGTFAKHQTDLCYTHFPEIPLHFCKSSVIYSVAMYWLGMGDWISYRESVMAIPDIPILMRKGYVETMQRRGILVLFWGNGKEAGGPGGGVNTPEKFEALTRIGVDGICTDRPEFLKEWLGSREQSA
ncbi:PLC-like phosphodiesterase [Rhizoclosmatium globosum]|uniref:PLC-like phosphodiesterase n=1 Tax=Rhizoclosmatium globosum TaxID=329046 RepID=A0A1Y2CR21_9FUNG|nr:PLC-like phosphodiesterase [Rhizoclosmatium globosum]|eukprot:ORY49462.1 PLC-like phosphodiesterase [Rhizoclosmatium globosum]